MSSAYHLTGLAAAYRDPDMRQSSYPTEEDALRRTKKSSKPQISGELFNLYHGGAKERTDLVVPDYAHRSAKRLGAKFDVEKGVLYMPPNTPLGKVMQWVPQSTLQKYLSEKNSAIN